MGRRRIQTVIHPADQELLSDAESGLQLLDEALDIGGDSFSWGD